MARLDDSARSKIEAPNLAFLATVMEDGSPQVSPTWIAMEDGNITFNTDDLARKYLGVDEYPWRKPGENRLKVVVEPVVVAR